MTAANADAGRADPSAGATGGYSPWAIAVVVALATFMEVLDTTIANVALRYISGGLAVGPDEAAWVVTSYLVANAITLTASSFLAKRYGRKMFFVGSIAVFTLASIACGFAWNLESLLMFRVIQGLAGGGMTPLAQSILADSFPPEKRGQAFALYGVAIVVAPVVGPTIGGWLSDNISWHWCFLINGPVGAATLVLMMIMLQDPPSAVEERRTLRARGVHFDVVGFVLVATFLGALEVVLDEGQRKDWFSSPMIITFAGLSALAFVLMIPWLLTRENPIVDLRLFFSSQFSSCFLVMLATGAILIASTQFIPQIVQTYYGYTATLSGILLAPGGLVTVVMMIVTGRLSSVVQPKWLIFVGASVIAFGLYGLTNLYADTTFWNFATSRMFIGGGLPLMFISITSASYVGLQKSQTDQASAIVNLARNVGGSLGVCLGQNVLAYRQQFHQSRLVEHIDPSNPAYQEYMNRVTEVFVGRGSSPAGAGSRATAYVGQVIQTQAAYWAYIDVFFSLALVAAAAVPLALILRKVPLGGPAPAAH